MHASAFVLVRELRQGLKVLKAQKLDAYFYTSDAMVRATLRSSLILARAKR
jgi:hypothetical protein